MDECWVPGFEYFEDYDNDWGEYESILYSIFKSDFLDSYPKYDGMRVNIKKYPYEYGKEDAFFHLTCKDYNHNGERVPDFRRCERIRWIRAFIENNCDESVCENCDGIKTWREPYSGKTRVHILLEEERYLVVLEHRPRVEDRPAYYLLITAFYLDYDNALAKQLKHYEQYRNQT